MTGTRPGTFLRRQVPVQGEVWDERRLGLLEADSVARCASSLADSFIWSLTYTDWASTRTGSQAVWNKEAHGMLAQTKNVEESLPLGILVCDFDTGSEWRNWTLLGDLQVHPKPIRVTRSRPYHSDDNAHGEHRMWPRHLRYGRLEAERLLSPINALYPEAWGPRHNFFLPPMKLV